MPTKCPPLKYHLLMFLSFLLETRGKARQKTSSLKRNMAWAEQQCSSSWVTLIRLFEELMKAAAPRGVLNMSFSILIHSGHTRYNSLNIPASHFHGWLLTKMDTEGDVMPHSTHFSSQVTHLAKSSAGGQQ